MTRHDMDYPSAMWDVVFANWMVEFRSILASNGITDDDWFFVLGDEEKCQHAHELHDPAGREDQGIDRR